MNAGKVSRRACRSECRQPTTRKASDIGKHTLCGVCTPRLDRVCAIHCRSLIGVHTPCVHFLNIGSLFATLRTTGIQSDRPICRPLHRRPFGDNALRLPSVECRGCFAPLRPASHPLHRVPCRLCKIRRLHERRHALQRERHTYRMSAALGAPVICFGRVVGALLACGRRRLFLPCLARSPHCARQSPSPFPLLPPPTLVRVR